MLTEATALAVGSGLIAGIWGFAHWRIKRRDVNKDTVKRDNVLQTKTKFDEVWRRINIIDTDKIPSLEARVDVIEAMQINYKEMSLLLDSKLETHLNPLLELERENSKELSALKDKVMRIEVENLVRNEIGVSAIV